MDSATGSPPWPTSPPRRCLARPAGPERRSRPPIPLRGHPGVAVTAPLTVTEMGFSLHAATHAGARDARARAALVKYILRPPIAQERLRLLPDDLVRIVLGGLIASDLGGWTR